MAVPNMALSANGHNHTHGWSNRKWVKKAINRKERREGKRTLDTQSKRKMVGYCW